MDSIRAILAKGRSIRNGGQRIFLPGRVALPDSESDAFVLVDQSKVLTVGHRVKRILRDTNTLSAHRARARKARAWMRACCRHVTP